MLSSHGRSIQSLQVLFLHFEFLNKFTYHLWTATTTLHLFYARQVFTNDNGDVPDENEKGTDDGARGIKAIREAR